jgi:hypothetical protein
MPLAHGSLTAPSGNVNDMGQKRYTSNVKRLASKVSITIGPIGPNMMYPALSSGRCLAWNQWKSSSIDSLGKSIHLGVIQLEYTNNIVGPYT